MKGFVSIYVDLPEGLSDEDLYHFNAFLDTKKNLLYEDIRNYLALTPADFGRKAKAEHGVKKGREKVELGDAEIPTEPIVGPAEVE